MTAILTLDVAAVRHNVRTLARRLSAQGIDIIGVTKAVDSEPDVARAMLAGGAVAVADSRLTGLLRLARHDIGPRILIRPPERHDVRLAAGVADWVLLSDLDTARALSGTNGDRRATGVLLVVDQGDRRDGALPDDAVALARKIADLPGLALGGVAVNFACLSGLQPELRLFEEADDIVARVSPWCTTPPMLSLGGTYCLPHLIEAFTPRHRCTLRLGAGIYFGHYTLPRVAPIAHLMRSEPVLSATVLECRKKPGPPSGTVDVDAFGRPPETRLPHGETYHVLLAMGRRESDIRCLHPFAPGSYVAGMSSDHTVLISPRPLAVGDTVRFALDYEGLVRAVTCGHVQLRWTETDHSLKRHRTARATGAGPVSLESTGERGDGSLEAPAGATRWAPGEAPRR
jgi:predicted amino acid racemase